MYKNVYWLWRFVGMYVSSVLLVCAEKVMSPSKFAYHIEW
jgi:hypothetical protein